MSGAIEVNAYEEARVFFEESWIDNGTGRPQGMLFTCPRCGASVAEKWTGAVMGDTNRVAHVEWHYDLTARIAGVQS